MLGEGIEPQIDLTQLPPAAAALIVQLLQQVQRKELELCVAFKCLKNFATVVPQKNRLLLYLHLDAARVIPLPPNGQPVSQKGRWGTGDLELSLSTKAHLDAAKPLILMSYEGRAPALAAGAAASAGRPRIGA